MPESKSDILQGTLDLMVLKIPLVRLVQKGWIKAEWGTSENNRKAKFYSFSRGGRKQLIAETENWERVSSVIGKWLQLGANS